MSSTLTQRAIVSFSGSSEDDREALRIRGQAYRARLGLDPQSWKEDRVRDACGLLPVMRIDGQAVASGRVLPVASPHCELRALGRLPGWADRDPELCEVNRVAAVNGTSRGLHSSQLFVLGITWLLSNTHFRRYISATRCVLVPFYEAIGAETVGDTFRIPSRSTAEYVAIHGSFAHTMQLAASFIGNATLEVAPDLVTATF
jgi:hypothetical protein